MLGGGESEAGLARQPQLAEIHEIRPARPNASGRRVRDSGDSVRCASCGGVGGRIWPLAARTSAVQGRKVPGARATFARRGP